jgi:hypothetical protein
MVIVVTAASSNHAGALRYLLDSLRALDARVEWYDLGLTSAEREAMPRWDRCFYHRFDYDAYPPHMNVRVNAGEYAWKPAIVVDVIDRLRASGAADDVVWADAGSYFHTLAPLAERLRASDGLYLRASSGTMQQWTHPGTFAYLETNPIVYASKPNADATLVGFATGHESSSIRERVYQDVIAPWKACAMEKACIAPAGSSRKNHRQDQAVLSLLVHRSGYTFAADTRRDLGVRCKCDRWFYQYVGFHVPPSVYARWCLY